MQRIAILGAGRIGAALLSGLVSCELGRHRRHGTKREPPRRAARAARRRGDDVEPEAVAALTLVVIAVKPQDIDALLAEIRDVDHEGSDCGLGRRGDPDGVHRGAHLPDGIPVVRAMPNAPSVVHEGMAGIAAGAHAGDEQLAIAEDVLAQLGRVVRVPENAMDAVTAISGSGPAYFALLAEAMIEAGMLLGLSREISTTARRADDARDGEAAARPGDASRRAARVGDLAGRDDDRCDPRARAGRRARRVPERDSGRDDARTRAVNGWLGRSTSSSRATRRRSSPSGSPR